jgi:hypothetical protein
MFGRLHSPLEEEILKSLTKHQPKTESELTSGALATSESAIRHAIADLRERSLIIDLGTDGYYIPYGCMRHWIRQNRDGGVNNDFPQRQSL